MYTEQCDECGIPLYRAGERVLPGTYLRVDDGSFQRLHLSVMGPLPASFDGHVALYRAAAASCACERRHTKADRAADHTVRMATATAQLARSLPAHADGDPRHANLAREAAPG